MKKILKAGKKGRISILILLLVSAAVTAVFFVAHRGPNEDANAVVATINGEKITVGEFRLHLNKNSAEVIGYFMQKYGSDGSGDFWNTPVGGELPSAVLKDRALKELVSYKVRQVLARQNGIIDDVSYSGFLKSLKDENNRRKKALDKGEVIYGPTEYGESNYYDYVFSNMELRLKEKLRDQLAGSEEELKQLYEKEKDNFYRKNDTIKVKQIYVPYLGDGAILTREQAEALAEQIRSGLLDGESFEELARQYNAPDVNTERVFDESTRYNDEKNESELLAAVKRLKQGELSGVLDVPNGRARSAGFYILFCMEKTGQGYKPFEEVRSEVEDLNIDANYTDYIDGLVRKAKVDIDKEVYDSLKI